MFFENLSSDSLKKVVLKYVNFYRLYLYIVYGYCICFVLQDRLLIYNTFFHKSWYNIFDREMFRCPRAKIRMENGIVWHWLSPYIFFYLNVMDNNVHHSIWCALVMWYVLRHHVTFRKILFRAYTFLLVKDIIDTCTCMYFIS